MLHFWVSVQPSAFRMNKKDQSECPSLAPDGVLGGSQYTRGGAVLLKGFYLWECLAAGIARESSFWRQKLKSKLFFPAEDFWREICPLKLCHHGWLTSSYSRIPLEHIMGNKFYSPSYMMFWGIHWGGRWDLWCMNARFWCYCKSHERLVLSDSPGSIQWCNYVKSALKF